MPYQTRLWTEGHPPWEALSDCWDHCACIARVNAVTNLRIVPPNRRPEPDERNSSLDAAKASLLIQARAISNLAWRVDENFQTAIELVIGCEGRLVLCGIGKSGHVARKLSATFSCSGTQSFFLHAGEAAHGDLGAVGRSDVAILISNSGETREVVRLIPFLREMGIPIISLVGNSESSMARNSDCVLDISVEREACPLDLTPTTSTLAAMAMGDALAMALMRLRGVSTTDFKRYHPGGSLGRNLGGRVRDFMRRHLLPTCVPGASVRDILPQMSNGHLGLIVITDEKASPLGLLTDGDLRRALQRHDNLLDLPVRCIMNTEPVTVHEGAKLSDARERMHKLRLEVLLVVDSDGKLTGVLEDAADQKFE